MGVYVTRKFKFGKFIEYSDIWAVSVDHYTWVKASFADIARQF